MNCLKITRIQCLIFENLNPIINLRNTTTHAVITKPVYFVKQIMNKRKISDTMDNHFCDMSVRLQSELPEYGNWFLEYLPHRISD